MKKIGNHPYSELSSIPFHFLLLGRLMCDAFKESVKNFASSNENFREFRNITTQEFTCSKTKQNLSRKTNLHIHFLQSKCPVSQAGQKGRAVVTIIKNYSVDSTSSHV